MQEEDAINQNKMQGGKDVTWHGGGGRWWCYGGVARVRRLRAVLWWFERRRERLLRYSVFLFRCFLLFSVCSGIPFLLSSFFSFFVCLVLSSFSLSRSLSSLSVLFLLPAPSVFFSIYRRERLLGPSLVRMGSGFRGRLVGHHPQGKAPPPCFRWGE